MFSTPHTTQFPGFFQQSTHQQESSQQYHANTEFYFNQILSEQWSSAPNVSTINWPTVSEQIVPGGYNDPNFFETQASFRSHVGIFSHNDDEPERPNKRFKPGIEVTEENGIDLSCSSRNAVIQKQENSPPNVIVNNTDYNSLVSYSHGGRAGVSSQPLAELSTQQTAKRSNINSISAARPLKRKTKLKDHQSYTPSSASQSFSPLTTVSQSYRPTAVSHDYTPSAVSSSYAPAAVGEYHISTSAVGQSSTPSTVSQSYYPSAVSQSYTPLTVSQSYTPLAASHLCHQPGDQILEKSNYQDRQNGGQHSDVNLFSAVGQRQLSIAEQQLGGGDQTVRQKLRLEKLLMDSLNTVRRWRENGLTMEVGIMHMFITWL